MNAKTTRLLRRYAITLAGGTVDRSFIRYVRRTYNHSNAYERQQCRDIARNAVVYEQD